MTKWLPAKSGRRVRAGGFRARAGRRGFTLVELLVSSVIIVMLCGMLMQMTSMTGRVYRNTQAKIEQFQAARTAFDSMTRKISEATLNTYWDYDNANASKTATAAPVKYIRQSELRFICGETAQIVQAPARKWTTKGVFFHAPLGYVDRSKPNYRGLESLMNAWGYFVEFGDDKDLRPAMMNENVIPVRNRFRLMEMMVPADNLVTYDLTSGGTGTPKNQGYSLRTWFNGFINTAPGSATIRPVHVLAENVIALLVVPKLSKIDEDRRASTGGAPLCRDYLYDTYYSAAKSYPDPEINPSNQLPPILQVTMVALDEASAAKLAGSSTNMPTVGSGLFADTTKLFDDPATPTPNDGDLAKLGIELAQQRLNYRVFTTNVLIHSARWSRDQK